MKRNKEWFVITRIHRDNLITAGFDGNSVDDYTTERLAEIMSTDYLEQLFWVHLDAIAGNFGIKNAERIKARTNGTASLVQAFYFITLPRNVSVNACWKFRFVILYSGRLSRYSSSNTRRGALSSCTSG